MLIPEIKKPPGQSLGGFCLLHNSKNLIDLIKIHFVNQLSETLAQVKPILDNVTTCRGAWEFGSESNHANLLIIVD